MYACIPVCQWSLGLAFMSKHWHCLSSPSLSSFSLHFGLRGRWDGTEVVGQSKHAVCAALSYGKSLGLFMCGCLSASLSSEYRSLSQHTLTNWLGACGRCCRVQGLCSDLSPCNKRHGKVLTAITATAEFADRRVASSCSVVYSVNYGFLGAMPHLKDLWACLGGYVVFFWAHSKGLGQLSFSLVIAAYHLSMPTPTCLRAM